MAIINNKAASNSVFISYNIKINPPKIPPKKKQAMIIGQNKRGAPLRW